MADENAFKKKLAPFNVRMIGIVWDIPSHPYHRLLRLFSERIVQRGDNHQTLRPDATIDAEHEAVVASFLHHFTSPDPNLFDKLIIVNIEDDSRAALVTVVNGLIDALCLPAPTPEAIDAALADARSQKTSTPFHGLSRVGKSVRYFGLAPEIDIDVVVNEALQTPSIPAATLASASAFLADLRANSRLTQKPHITLAHEKNVTAEKEASGPGPHAAAWDTCVALAEARLSPLYEFDVTHLVWDGRVMAIVVAAIRPAPLQVGETAADADADSGAETDSRGAGLPLVLPAEVEANLHVTVGTQGEDISAFESRGVVRAMREAVTAGAPAAAGETGAATEAGGNVHWVAVGPITGTGRIRGMY
jgi:tRNA ligase